MSTFTLYVLIYVPGKTIAIGRVSSFFQFTNIYSKLSPKVTKLIETVDEVADGVAALSVAPTAATTTTAE
jgi:hypothetical protein